MQPRTSSNVNSSPSPWASCPGRAHSAASAACAGATDALSSCVAGSRSRAMAAVNASSAVAFAPSVVHDAPVSGWRNEGIPWRRGAAARRSSHLCITYYPGDIRQWRAHVRSSLSRCALRAARTAAVNSQLVAGTSPRAAASYGLQSISRMEARRRLMADCTAGVNQFF